ncbi:hypothetical protein NP493_713g01002 [Ridgeia piscesae]|uniref:Uncharacterized protein n=1 Tax=Ridgeia piscesae TaxID=27915 RepID=A0AAD9NP80_RIDPI|nr:hypothetical protein NP493_713g01002 [Ridgeia piscesae]
MTVKVNATVSWGTTSTQRLRVTHTVSLADCPRSVQLVLASSATGRGDSPRSLTSVTSWMISAPCLWTGLLNALNVELIVTRAPSHVHETWRHTVGATAATSRGTTPTMASRHGYATATAAATNRSVTNCARSIVTLSVNKSGVYCDSKCKQARSYHDPEYESVRCVS